MVSAKILSCVGVLLSPGTEIANARKNKKERKSSVIKRHYNVIHGTSGRNNAARSARIALSREERIRGD